MALPYVIRPIARTDNPTVAAIIRTVMPEFGAGGTGFAIHDPEVNDMFAAYQSPRHSYYVVEVNGEVQGCGGVAPLAGGDADTCELRKMYFLPRIRGLGAGSALMEKCLADARAFQFKICYLETLANMTQARKLYERFGFKRLAGPLGNTGHSGCNTWYGLEL
jgi:putative acetyltransferase